MTELKTSLAGDTATTANIAVTLNFSRRQKLVEVRLEGAVLKDHAKALRNFLTNVTDFPGNKWILHLENLEVMSVRALRVLVEFAKVIRHRGYEVEIPSIQSTILATMLELNLHEYFGWDTLKRRSSFSKITRSRELSLIASEHEE